ncbi:MAG: peptidyl-prolyl cis-trans isomerase [PS1 clade bacterium]|uniref:Parvulin-like PPIase n=1 Tax=PS1 clade bacterium TaxID=2175152 RepID=A0A368E0L8_9PROT|nr:MAG: peptidyl-prolyl cis-trans isomerase [PS1 clade bacterium]
MGKAEYALKNTFLFTLAGLAGLTFALLTALGILPPQFGNHELRARGDVPIASVNGESVSKVEYLRALTAMQAGLDRSLSETDKRAALQVLIDEEVILQHALNIGLARSDPMARKNLVQALMRSTALLTDYETDTQKLETFFKENKHLFVAPRMVRVKVLTTDKVKTADTFRQAMINGETFDAAGRHLGLTEKNLPDDIPLGKAADYLGGTARDRLATLKEGEIIGPIKSGSESDRQYMFIWLMKATRLDVEFNEVAEIVKAEWQRRQEEKAFETYLSNLRQTADIRLHNDVIETVDRSDYTTPPDILN